MLGCGPTPPGCVSPAAPRTPSGEARPAEGSPRYLLPVGEPFSVALAEAAQSAAIAMPLFSVADPVRRAGQKACHGTEDEASGFGGLLTCGGRRPACRWAHWVERCADTAIVDNVDGM